MAGSLLGGEFNVLIHGCEAAGLSVDKINRALKSMTTQPYYHLEGFLKIRY